jgi:hypothetical protein
MLDEKDFDAIKGYYAKPEDALITIKELKKAGVKFTPGAALLVLDLAQATYSKENNEAYLKRIIGEGRKERLHK